MVVPREFSDRFVEMYHSIACEVLGLGKPSWTLLSEFPGVMDFFSHVRRSSDRRMAISAVDAIGSAIPMFSEAEFLVALIDLVSGCVDGNVDPILRTTVVNRFIEISSDGANWLMLRDKLPDEILRALKVSLQEIVEMSWQGRRAEVCKSNVEAAFA